MGLEQTKFSPLQAASPEITMSLLEQNLKIEICNGSLVFFKALVHVLSSHETKIQEKLYPTSIRLSEISAMEQLVVYTEYGVITIKHTKSGIEATKRDSRLDELLIYRVSDGILEEGSLFLDERILRMSVVPSEDLLRHGGIHAEIPHISVSGINREHIVIVKTYEGETYHIIRSNLNRVGIRQVDQYGDAHTIGVWTPPEKGVFAEFTALRGLNPFSENDQPHHLGIIKSLEIAKKNTYHIFFDRTYKPIRQRVCDQRNKERKGYTGNRPVL